MKSLMVGQVPKEYGAAITTGAALVAIELLKRPCEGLDLALYATNIPNSIAKTLKTCKIYGYSKNPLIYLWTLLIHPSKSLRHLRFYRRVMHVNPLRFFFYEVNIHKAIQRMKPDIIHTHGLIQYMSAYFAADGKIPLLATLHGYWKTNKDDVRIMDATMPYVDNISTLTHMAETDIRRDYPKNFQTFDIVTNGADTDKFFFSPEQRFKVRSALGVSDTTPVFITVASVQERKGQLRFIQYLQDCDLKDYLYLIIGRGAADYEQIMRTYIEENGLSEKVKMVGYVNNTETYRYYSAADFYAHVSQNEGQSLSELEAASTGLRIIVNKPLIGTMPEDITCKDNIYYLLDYDVVNKEAFEKWCTRKQMDRHSLEIYDWNNVVKDYLATYRKIVSL